MGPLSTPEEKYSISFNDVRSFLDYSHRLQNILNDTDWTAISLLCQALRDCWSSGRKVFLCGNGGSAGNALHIANDLLFGVDPSGMGMRVEALAANPSIISCLANDIGYENIFSHQLSIQAEPQDILIALSGSGNSPNIVKAIEQASEMGVSSFAILGYSGGVCKDLADVAIHFPVDDMQISEDLQIMVGHMVTQALRNN